MNQPNFHWFAVSRSELSSVVFGRDIPRTGGDIELSACIRSTGIALAIPERHGPSNYTPPTQMVIRDDCLVETLAWMRAYAPELSPLSQFCRVMLWSDYENCREDTLRVNVSGSSPLNGEVDRWASVVLGELLAQGDTDVELRSVALTHAASCFSTPYLKSSQLYSRRMEGVFLDRLQFLAGERRFARRLLTVDSLAPVWALLHEFVPDGDAQMVVEAAISRVSYSHLAIDGVGQLSRSLSTQVGLLSDSVEERVKAFQQLLLRLNAEYGEPLHPVPNLLAAAGAFLVGRGTSHLFLLRRAAKKWPASLAWFGAFAALGGPRFWDADWMRASKGVERALRQPSQESSVMTADLSWVEFEWLAKVFEGPEVFGSVPKLLPKNLSVELLPGAVCQMRLAAESSGATTGDFESDHLKFLSSRIQELETLLGEFVTLASKSRHFLEDTTPTRSAAQGTFGFDDAGRITRASRRGRKLP